VEFVPLRTERMVLDLPVHADRDLVAAYCADPVFERFMTTPWPYRLKDADFFVDEFVPKGWADGSELTWALRLAARGPLIGVIGWRRQRQELGFWLGAPYRGFGYMTEATNALTDWLFDTQSQDVVRWECIQGNTDSAGVARKAGFRYTGERRSTLPMRKGDLRPSWHAELRPGDPHEPTRGWPTG